MIPPKVHPKKHGDIQRLRAIAIAAAFIAGCSVLLVTLLAWRLLDTRERVRVATTECSCCGPNDGPSQGAIHGAP